MQGYKWEKFNELNFVEINRYFYVNLTILSVLVVKLLRNCLDSSNFSIKLVTELRANSVDFPYTHTSI